MANRVAFPHLIYHHATLLYGGFSAYRMKPKLLDVALADQSCDFGGLII